MIPATAMGLDTTKFLTSAKEMVEACKADADNPGLTLGAILGTLANHGRDKITIIACTQPIGIVGYGSVINGSIGEDRGFGDCRIVFKKPKPS